MLFGEMLRTLLCTASCVKILREHGSYLDIPTVCFKLGFDSSCGYPPKKVPMLIKAANVNKKSPPIIDQ